MLSYRAVTWATVTAVADVAVPKTVNEFLKMYWDANKTLRPPSSALHNMRSKWLLAALLQQCYEESVEKQSGPADNDLTNLFLSDWENSMLFFDNADAPVQLKEDVSLSPAMVNIFEQCHLFSASFKIYNWTLHEHREKGDRDKVGPAFVTRLGCCSKDIKVGDHLFQPHEEGGVFALRPMEPNADTETPPGYRLIGEALYRITIKGIENWTMIEQEEMKIRLY